MLCMTAWDMWLKILVPFFAYAAAAGYGVWRLIIGMGM